MRHTLLFLVAACLVALAGAEGGADPTNTANVPATKPKVGIVANKAAEDIKKETVAVQEDELNFMPVRFGH